MRNTSYRSDIDGLRALAILPVLLFHATVPGFSGGFVGVDVFFVISGYLISTIISSEIMNGKFSIANFYERRIRRIFPALLVMIFFVLAAAPLFMLPSEFISISKEALGALFFVANIIFWRESGYFAADAESKPLLHTWSLGVEEQFYVFAPLFFFLTLHYFWRWKVWLTFIALLISLALSVLLTPVMQSAAFYLLPTRAWELLAGSLLAFMPHMTHIENKQWFREVTAGAGLIFLLFSVFLIDSEMLFPGYAAVLPVLGACLIIRYAHETKVGSIISAPLLVFIGLISYSLYLWHWPLIVIFRDAGLLETNIDRVIVIAFSVFAAWMSWRFVEGPTRSRERFGVRPLLVAIVAIIFCVIVICISYYRLDGWPSRFPAQVVAFDNAHNDISPAREHCHANRGLPDPAKSCVLGGGVASVAVWADSHGVELSQAISELGVPVRSLTYSACTPALGYTSRAYRPQCVAHNTQVMNYLLHTPAITTVVLTTYFSPEQQNYQLQLIKNSAKQLHNAGKHVILVGPTPGLGNNIDIPTWLARGGGQYFKYSGLEGAVLRSELSGVAEVLLPEDIFCRKGVCDLLPLGRPLIFDTHHPSMHAARITATQLLPLLNSSTLTHKRLSPT